MRNVTQGSSDDRYEWLSAYIDDELVPHDRQRVEQWLAIDPDYQACYRRLMQMRRGFQGLQDQELANLTLTPIQTILEASPPFNPSCSQPGCSPQGSGLGNRRWLVALVGGGGLGLTLLWTAGLRSLWPEPVAQSSPEESVASVASPLMAPATTPYPAPQTSAPLPSPSQASTTSALLVSTQDNPGESGLTFALDQPLVAFPAGD